MCLYSHVLLVLTVSKVTYKCCSLVEYLFALNGNERQTKLDNWVWVYWGWVLLNSEVGRIRIAPFFPVKMNMNKLESKFSNLK